MEAYRIGDHVIAADTEEDAGLFYKHEVGKDLPPVVEALECIPRGAGGGRKDGHDPGFDQQDNGRAQCVASDGRSL